MILILVVPVQLSHISVTPYSSHCLLEDLIQSFSSATSSSKYTMPHATSST
ncbi:unnamed protein product [Musa textilis]